jgi:transcriptional accessory protein Tex/SPT6
MPEQMNTQPSSIEELQPKMHLNGTVTRTELYGAFVDLGLERDGLIHISRLAPHRVKKVTDEVNVGDSVNVWVHNVDPDRGRIALTMVEPPEVDWSDLDVNRVFEGKVVRIERYGAFIDIGAERPGLLHVREMGAYVRNPEEIVRIGDTLDVKVTSLDRRKKQIDLTMYVEAEEMPPEEEDEEDAGLSAMEIAFLQAQALSSEDRRSRTRKNKRQRRDQDMDDIYRRTLEGN